MAIKLKTETATRDYDLAHPIDLSIPLRFNGPQPNAYGVAPAASEPVQAGTLIGDTRRGGSCNFEKYTFIPHCSGTHTECVGHITKERISVRDCLQDVLIPARLISVEPVGANETGDRYAVGFRGDDQLITREILAAALKSDSGSQAGDTDLALVIRTLPNDENKLDRLYDGSYIPPYFTTEAMQYI
jgi:arylformamidase